jgi:hypothetical protein
LSVSEFYDLTLELLDKNQSTPTPIATTGKVINGDLSPFRASLELINTGNTKTDHGVLKLRIPQDGTFVSVAPILVNEEAKDNYVIQAQIKQPDGSGGTRAGKVFRFTIGSPIIEDSPEMGETVTLNLLSIEYRVKEHLSSKQLFLKSPKDAFEERLDDYNTTRGSLAPEINFLKNQNPSTNDSIQLPDSASMHQSYIPFAPTKTHDLLSEITGKLAEPIANGGTFQDYYFDFESNSVSGNISTGNINKIDIHSELFGKNDSGVVLDPLSDVSPVDAEKNKTVTTDLKTFKNNIILSGSADGGTLPMERSRFNSEWQHAQARNLWLTGITRYNDDVKYGTDIVKAESISGFSGKKYMRFFKWTGLNADTTNTVSPINTANVWWKEDFSLIPTYSDKAEYDEFEVVCMLDTSASPDVIRFYELLPVAVSSIIHTSFNTQVVTHGDHDLVTGQVISIQGSNDLDHTNVQITVTSKTAFNYYDTGSITSQTGISNYTVWVRGSRLHIKGDPAPNSTPTPVKWKTNAFNPIRDSLRVPFYSYTPWTSDYELQLANLSGTPAIPVWSAGTYNAKDEVQKDGKWYFVDGLTGTTTATPPNSPWAESMKSNYAEWDTSRTYFKNESVSYNIGNVVVPDWQGYISKVSSNQGNTPPTSSPWTSSYWDHLQVPTWAGAVPDMNFERANFDRVESEDQFEPLSLKAVSRCQRVETSIPSQEVVNGARFLINGVGQGLYFYNHDNQIAEWYEPPFTTGQWKFSKTPDKETEAVVDLNTAQIWKWTGTSWEVFWSPKPDNCTTTSMFHCVTNGERLGLDSPKGNTRRTGFGLVAGATQIPAQAIRLTYHWDQVFGSNMNLSSRGAWWVQHLPIPFRQNAGGITRDIGAVYKNSLLDTANLDRDRKGNQGWNNGLDSEDLGSIVSLTMKVKLSARDDRNRLCHGYANFPMVAWAIDVFGRIRFENFTLKRNGQYDHVRVSFGKNASSELYHNRIDELFTLWGFNFSYDWFLKEKQFTGIAFDWRFVKSWGIFWDLPYDDNHMYTGVRDAFTDSVTSWAKQVGNHLLHSASLGGIPHENYVVDHVTLDIDELAFEKNLYVNSDDTAVSNARTEMESHNTESDYLNLKQKSKGVKARKQFIPQQWYVMAHGDVRMRLGKKFHITGSRVPEQVSNYPNSAWLGITYDKGDKVTMNGYVWKSLQNNNSGKNPTSVDGSLWWANMNESVCHEVKHIINSDGYTMGVTGVRKFVYN